MKRIIEIEESDLERIREIVERENKTALSVTTRGTAYITIADSKLYDDSGDLISREALKDYARKVICGDNPTNSLIIRMFDEIIDNAPTVDLWQMRQEATENALKKAEVLYGRPQGEWYYNYQNGWHCSICHKSVKDMPTVMGKANFAFCPNCGADMRGGAE